MNVGDRVRLLTGTEEGIVTRLLDSELVEVAIDNDFTIPVLRREVVVVAQEEGNNFDRAAPDFRVGQVPGKNANASKKDRSQRPTTPAAAKPAQPSLQEALAAVASSGAGVAKVGGGTAAGSSKQAAAAKGLFLALVHQSPELLAVTLINNTEADVLYTYGEETSARPYRALAADKLGPKASTKPLSFLHMKDFENWPAAVFQLLPHRHNGESAYELLTKRQAFKASTFYSSSRPAPVIGKDAYLFQLDEKAAAAIAPEQLAQAAPVAAPAPAKPAGVDAAALKAQLTGDAPAKPAAVIAATTPTPAAPVVAPSHEFDLHLEALRPDNKEELSNTAILRIQLDAFEDALSRALATNMHEIVFIHGMGNGVLRKEIHRQLSRNKDIKFFEDARKEKFGFGATLVRLK
ncbi:Smr/MutS family protein [Hymenobacter sp. BT683]|uniref:Smr/MutS family protein n=1 Tax=Hymenobacter jeongseonensis TaxID=2791027 RepID=A0ABS0IHX9_9BACT|nr:Smr/MutS family protein [Hymenobacter jeongseonensis]MBF9237955.1 Smr/MutS family protein [Hymenobacter jeongseonensis]